MLDLRGKIGVPGLNDSTNRSLKRGGSNLKIDEGQKPANPHFNPIWRISQLNHSKSTSVKTSLTAVLRIELANSSSFVAESIHFLFEERRCKSGNSGSN